MKSTIAFLLLSASVCFAADTPRMPDHQLTPGVAASITTRQLCAKSFHTPDVRAVNGALKKEVYARYGLKLNNGYCKPRPYITRKGKKIHAGMRD